MALFVNPNGLTTSTACGKRNGAEYAKGCHPAVAESP